MPKLIADDVREGRITYDAIDILASRYDNNFASSDLPHRYVLRTDQETIPLRPGDECFLRAMKIRVDVQYMDSAVDDGMVRPLEFTGYLAEKLRGFRLMLDYAHCEGESVSWRQYGRALHGMHDASHLVTELQRQVLEEEMMYVQMHRNQDDLVPPSATCLFFEQVQHQYPRKSK